MIGDKKVVCFVPMKIHSSRVPFKNIRNFDGKPLCYYILKTLMDVSFVDLVVVDTDSDVIKKLCLEELFPGEKKIKTKKTRTARTIILPAVSRRDLCYVSENDRFRFCLCCLSIPPKRYICLNNNYRFYRLSVWE